MQVRHLKTFVAVATSLNVTRAAERIHLAQSSVTEQIQTLEADLGTKLFDRSRRELKLTEAGRRLLDYAGDILALTDEARSAVADAANIIEGTLIIGALETLCASRLPPLLAQFQSKHSSVRLQLKAAGSGELRRDLMNGVLDVGFAFGAGPFGSDLQHEFVTEEDLIVIAPPGHRLAGLRAVRSEELTKEPFLVTEVGCVYRQMFESGFPAGRGGQPRIAGEFGSIAAIRQLVEAGLGCALVPRLIVSGAEGQVATLPWSEGGSVPVSMVWRRRRIQPPILRQFLAAARQSFSTFRSGDGHPQHAVQFQ
jgi:DNA-binding transcriptional LysR family regulator